MTVAEQSEATSKTEVLLSFIFDTSAFVSLESVYLLDIVLNKDEKCSKLAGEYYLPFC